MARAGDEGGKARGEGEGNDDCGGERHAAKARHGSRMDFTSVVEVEELLLVRDEDDFRENHPRGQSGKQEGRNDNEVPHKLVVSFQPEGGIPWACCGKSAAILPWACILTNL